MDTALLTNILCYLDGHCSLHKLEVWLLANLQSILDSGDNASIEIANYLDADLIQYGEGLIEEGSVVERLRYSLKEGPMTESEKSRVSCGYLQARGVAPRKPGAPLAEEVIRRIRDADDDDKEGPMMDAGEGI